MQPIRPDSSRRAGAPALAFLLVCSAIGLAACGGSSSPSPSPSPGPSPVPVPVPAPGPVAAGTCQAFPTSAGTAVNGSVAAGVTAPSGRTLTYSVDTQPSRGNLSLASDGSFSYTPTTNARGYADTFGFRVTDNTGASATATAKVVYGTRRILPLGDSITFGIESSIAGNNTPTSGSAIAYRKRLRELLVGAGYAVEYVGTQSAGSAAGLTDPQHDGYPGERSDQIDARVAGGLLTTVRPDVVLLHIGTNDTISGSTSTASLNSILTRMNGYAANGSNNPVSVALAKIINQRPNAPTVNLIPQFNANLTALYNGSWADPGNANATFKVRLADHFSAIDPANDLTPIAQDDPGLHPNTSGYNKMAQVWFDTLVDNGFVAKCP